MKVYVLYSGNLKIALCNDVFLIELFIVQRKIKDYKVEEQKAKKEIKNYNTFLVYYYGYAITMREMEFIEARGMEYISDLEFMIFELESFIDKHRKYMTKKEIKAINKTVRILKDKKKNKNLIFSKEMIDMVVNQPSIVDEYLDNIEMFKNCMEGDI